MSEALHLIVTLAGERIAIPAAQVSSVMEVEGVTRVPRAAPHVAGLAALRNRVVTLIDCRIVLGIAPAAAGGMPRDAVIVRISGHDYGLLVDGVDEVLSATPAPPGFATALDPVWQRAGAGMVCAGDALLPALSAEALVGGASLAA